METLAAQPLQLLIDGASQKGRLAACNGLGISG